MSTITATGGGAATQFMEFKTASQWRNMAIGGFVGFMTIIAFSFLMIQLSVSLGNSPRYVSGTALRALNFGLLAANMAMLVGLVGLASTARATSERVVAWLLFSIVLLPAVASAMSVLEIVVGLVT